MISWNLFVYRNSTEKQKQNKFGILYSLRQNAYAYSLW